MKKSVSLMIKHNQIGIETWNYTAHGHTHKILNFQTEHVVSRNFLTSGNWGV